jgi:hypothetical protein
MDGKETLDKLAPRTAIGRDGGVAAIVHSNRISKIQSLSMLPNAGDNRVMVTVYGVALF